MADEPDRRFTNYFGIVGLRSFDLADDVNLRAGPFATNFKGEILEVFPKRGDRPPFDDAISLFCQPAGWKVTREPFQPTYYSFVLTDMLGKKMYAACMSVPERHTYAAIRRHFDGADRQGLLAGRDPSSTTVLVDPAGSGASTPTASSIASASSASVIAGRAEEGAFLQDADAIYAPKSLVILSYHPYFSVFRACLCALYDVFQRGSPVNFNRWVSFLITEVPLPPLGRVGVRFLLGDAEIQVSRPSRQILPLVDFPLERFFRTLGIDLILQLVASLLFEHKVLFVSRHHSQLLLAAESLSTLVFPFTVQHTYIPILPYKMLEGIEAPTPFIMGIHQSLYSALEELSDLSDIAIIDLDSAKVVNGYALPSLSKEEGLLLHESLLAILQPDLVAPDCAFYREILDELKEKKSIEAEIRTCFLRFFVSLFHDYRSFFTLIKLFPEPVVFFQKNAFLHKYPQRRKFLEPFLATSMFDSFIREDGAALELGLFARLTEEYSDLLPFPTMQCSDVESHVHIKNPLERGETSAPTPACGDARLELAAFGPVEPPPGAYATPFSALDAGAPGGAKVRFSEDLQPRTSQQPTPQEDAELKTVKELALALFQAKKISPTYSLDPEKVFQSPRNRVAFARELGVRCAEKQPFEQKLEEPQFDFLCAVVKKVLTEARRCYEGRTVRSLASAVGYFFRAPKTTFETHYFLYDFLRESQEEMDLLSDLAFWEEAFFVAVDTQRRTQYKGLVEDAVAAFRAQGDEEQVARCEKEDDLIFGELRQFVIMMARLGFPLSETQKFIEGMALGCLLNDTLTDRLYECTEEWTSREAERLHSKREAEDGGKKKNAIQGHFIENASFPELILLDGEQITSEVDKVLYVSPHNDVAEGKLIMSNFKICFVGYYLQGPSDLTTENVEQDDSQRKKRKVTIDINFGSIFELTKTAYTSVKKGNNTMWVPEGIEIQTGDFQIATFCIDDEGDIGPRDLMNMLSRLAFPTSQENMFAFSFNPVDLKGTAQADGAFLPPAQRRCFNDAFNERLDGVLMGITRELQISSEWRVSTGNEKFGICPSYPRYLVVPHNFTDEDINTLAKFHKKKRFPLLCWRHPVNKCYLLRAALPKSARGNNTRCEIDELMCNTLAETSAYGKVSILTEKEHTTLVNDILYKTSQKNLGFYYANVNFIHAVGSGQDFSPSVMQSRFIKFLGLCSKPEDIATFWSAAEENWLYVISDLLRLSYLAIEQLEGNTSVIVALEDGWDRTTQVVSLVQLLMDPWYRTIAGFQCLLEKEWLKFGHKFGQRMGQMKDSRTEKAPVFLQFMDCVHQLTCQYPTEFEFNEKFLRDLVVEVCAARFGSFLFNSESERLNNCVFTKTHSLWTMLNLKHEKTPDFYNFQYLAGSWHKRSELVDVERTLVPDWSMSVLKIWEPFYFFHFGHAEKSPGADYNEECKDLLNQYEQFSILQMGQEDADSPRKEGRNLWLETWTNIMAKRENRLETRPPPIPRMGSTITHNAVSSPDAEVVLDGYLYKQGGMVKNWKQRWFVLNAREMRCYYFTDKTKADGKGYIDLSSATDVRAVDTPAPAPQRANLFMAPSFTTQSAKPAYRFEIVTPGRTFLIEAANAPSRIMWIEALRKVIRLNPGSGVL